MMFPQTNRSELRTVWVLVFYLLLRRFCEGQSNLTGTSQTIKAMHGDGVILPCYVKPAMDVTGLTLEWTIPDLERRFVYVWRDGVEFVGKKHKSFTGRTTLFTDELKHGNISLKLSKVRISDRGKFRCFIPQLGKEFIVQLDVGAVSSPVLSLSGLHRDSGAVEFHCESGGWYPKPEVLWLDGEGKLLSAGPTETVRGPDDLYTVSSRLTVENRLSNSFTCRVHQNHINQTRDTHITVTDDFFMFQPDSTGSTITGLAVSLSVICIVLIVAVVSFVVWRRNMMKRQKQEETERGENQNVDKSNKSEMQRLTEGTETEPLNKNQPVSENNKLENKAAESRSLFNWKIFNNQQLQEERRSREKAEEEVQTLKKQLETYKHKVEELQSSTASGGSVSGFISVEVNLDRTCVVLYNMSAKDQQLEGFEIHIRVDNRKPIMFTFNKCIIEASRTVTVWAAGCIGAGTETFLEWSNQKPWVFTDKLQVTLFSSSGEEISTKCEKTKMK